jgi:hypothetical protein
LKIKTHPGFSFIELNIVVVLLAVLGVLVYQSFSSGVKIWQRIKDGSGDVQVAVFFDKITNDLHNLCVFSRILGYGSQKELSFTTVDYVHQDKTSYLGLGRVRYYFDQDNKDILRTFNSWKAVKVSKYAVSPSPIVEKVESLSFSYYYPKKKQFTEIWDSQSDNPLPSAVRVNIRIIKNNRAVDLSRIINLCVN